MGGQQSKVRITTPKDTHCFPSFENEPDLFETVKQIENCHLQALRAATWIASMIAAPHGTAGNLAFSAATILFTFLIHSSTPNSSSDVNSKKDERNNNNDKETPGTTLEDALIDSKVSTAIAKKSVCELQAKVCVINNRYQRLLSDITVEDRRLEVVPAIQTCEEVLQLFHDPTHVFRLNPLVSTPFLVTFAGIFVAVAELSLVLIPSYKSPLVGEINLLKETLTLYKSACIQTRMDNLKFRRLQPESMLNVVSNGMSELNYNMEDACLIGKKSKKGEGGSVKSSMEEDKVDKIYQDANEAVAAYKKALEDEYEKFFKAALEAISKFSAFGNKVCIARCIKERRY